MPVIFSQNPLLRKLYQYTTIGMVSKMLYGLFVDLSTQDLIKDLPLEVIRELTYGMAHRLALQVHAGQLSLDEARLGEIAKACWDAIAR